MKEYRITSIKYCTFKSCFVSMPQSISSFLEYKFYIRKHIKYITFINIIIIIDQLQQAKDCCSNQKCKKIFFIQNGGQFAARVLQQCRAMRITMYACFVDFCSETLLVCGVNTGTLQQHACKIRVLELKVTFVIEF